MYAQPLALGLRPSAHPLLQLRRGWWPRAGSCGLATSARVGQLAAATTVVASSSSSSGPSNVNASAQRPRTWRDFGHPSRRATDVLLVVTCLLYAAQTLLPGLLLLGAKVNPLITQGQLWRLVTPAFLHSNLIHLAVNLASLDALGPFVENVSGPSRMLAVYFGSVLSCSVLSYCCTPGPAIGASGAIFGLGAAMSLFAWRHRDMYARSDSVLRGMAQSLVLNVAFSLFAKNIDNWGHFGGALGGAVFAWLLGPRYRLASSQVEGSFLEDRPPLPLLASPQRLPLGPSSRSRPPPGRGDGHVTSSSSASSRGKASQQPGPRRRRWYFLWLR